MITEEQARMARALLCWTVKQTAERAKVSPNTVTRFETGGNVNEATKVALRVAYEAGGAVFVAAGETSSAGGPGVRVRAG